MVSSILIMFVTIIIPSYADYWTTRDDFISNEESLIVGSQISLTDREQLANEVLMAFKHAEFDAGFMNPLSFPPTRHFFESRLEIENSETFKIISMLPKGCSLHSHDTALVSGEFLYNLTYSENLYACEQNGRLRLQFFCPTPANTCNWTLLSDLRSKNSSFDDWLKTQLTIIVPDPYTAYPDINSVWTAFINTLITVTPMLTYRPVWKMYFYQVLKELYEDNVMYIEFRTTLPNCYDLDGTTYGAIEVARFYKEVTEEFMEHYPDFQGVRLIYAPLRSVDNATMDTYMQTALQLKMIYGDFIAGFDLVGQEDLGRPLEDFISQLLQMKQYGIRFFFHAGETNWYGSSTDFNLVDAVLLNTTRIGHGFALNKHPEVLRVMKEQNIAIEINPISSQVLKLVDDIRNHPGSFYIANNYPIIISNDDPGFWGAKALSYDWYIAFMGMASRNTDLKFLKQIAINSYLYNVMNDTEKTKAIDAWNVRWNDFIETVITNYS